MIASEDAARNWLRKRPDCGVSEFARLEVFADTLRRESEQQNLASKGSLDQIWLRHIVDSAQLLDHVPRGTMTWLDLGTGAGLPGIVVAVLDSEKQVFLVEPRKRRIEWLERVIRHLDLRNVTVFGTRAESLEIDSVGVISARALAPLERVLHLSARFSTSDTLWLLPKGRSAAQELGRLQGWRHMFHVKPSLTDPNSGIIVGKLTGGKETSS